MGTPISSKFIRWKPLQGDIARIMFWELLQLSLNYWWAITVSELFMYPKYGSCGMCLWIMMMLPSHLEHFEWVSCVSYESLNYSFGGLWTWLCISLWIIHVSSPISRSVTKCLLDSMVEWFCHPFDHIYLRVFSSGTWTFPDMNIYLCSFYGSSMNSWNCILLSCCWIV